MIGRNTAAGEKLTSYADRIERLLDEVDGLKQDLKDVKDEAKGEGFNVQALVKLVSIRRNKKRADAEAMLLNDLVLYAHATGTPLDVAMSMDEWPPRAEAGRHHVDGSARDPEHDPEPAEVD